MSSAAGRAIIRRARSARNSRASSIEAYRARLVSETLYGNELYLTLVWHPGRDATERASLFFSRLARAQRAGGEVDAFGLKKLEDVSRDLMAALDRYRPRRLGLVERHGVVFSETGSFLQELVACEKLPFPLVQGPIGPALYANRLIFGRETIEIRGPGGSRFAGMLAFKDYPATTRPGLLDGLLAAPFELVLAQSFAFLGKAEAKTVMTRKQNQLLSANDPAASQIDELDAALDDLESNRFVMGEHHLSVLVFADAPRTLLDKMSQARRILADAGAVVAREDLGLEAAFWAQLPGLFKYRARAGAISSRNFAGLSPFHAYPSGKADGQPLGAFRRRAEDRLGIALSFLVPCRRSRQHLHLRTLRLGQDRFPDLRPGAGGETELPARPLRQGSRRRALHPGDRRRLPHFEERQADGLRALEELRPHALESRLPRRVGAQARQRRGTAVVGRRRTEDRQWTLGAARHAAHTSDPSRRCASFSASATPRGSARGSNAGAKARPLGGCSTPTKTRSASILTPSAST